MKVLHITTIDVGGAYKAALRLHESLQLHGVESKILLRTKTKQDNIGEECFANSFEAGVSKAKNVWNLLHAKGEITRDVWGTDISKHKLVQEADIIVLHWINSFLSLRELRKLSDLKKPIIWFMHDMWLFTGGCHVDKYCGRYEEGCGNCPLIKNHDAKDISYRNFRDKRYLLQNMNNVTIAGPSQWIVDCAKKSVILKGKQIICLPNMLNTEIFRPIKNKEELRSRYGMNTKKQVILFGAADSGTENENKGFRYLIEALEELPREEYQLAVFGNTGKNMRLPVGFEIVLLGFISDERKLAEIYNTADVFVNPSNQESFGYTTCEAMACGTPVVAFPIGGLKEQITHMHNGYLAEYHNSKDLAEGIRYCTANKESLSVEAVNSASKYAYQNMVKNYITLFEKISI